MPPDSFGGLGDWEGSRRRPVRNSTDPVVREMLRACSAGDRVCIHYSRGDGTTQQRWIRPAAVFTVDGYSAVYVQAFCELRQAERVFRADRMRLVAGSSRAASAPARTQTGPTRVPPTSPGLPRSSIHAPGQRGAARPSTPRKVHPGKAARTDPAWQRFNRLLSYYLDCIREDEGFGVAVRISDAGDKWLPLATREAWAFSGDEGQEVPLPPADKSFASYLWESRASTSLFYGYPVFVQTGRDGRPVVYPVLLLPLDHEADESRLRVTQGDGWPRLNGELVQALGLRREEVCVLLDTLGLGASDAEPPAGGLVESAARLPELEVFADPAEPIDPTALTTPTGRPLSVKQTGLHNWAGLYFADRPSYTRSLERELTQLRDSVPEDQLARSALRFFFRSSESAGPVSDRPPAGVVKVSPLNEGQTQAVRAGLSSPVAVVTGPPGTGKSQVVVNVLANAYLAGQSVLFSSRNNKAVDVVEERIGGLSQGKLLLRAGSRYSARDFRGEILKFLAHALATQASAAERAECDRLRAQLAELNDRIENALGRLERIRVTRDRVNQLDARIVPARTVFSAECLAQLEVLAADRRVLGAARRVVARMGSRSGPPPSAGGWLAHRLGLWRARRAARRAVRLLEGFPAVVPEALLATKADDASALSVSEGLGELWRRLELASLISEYRAAYAELATLPRPEALAAEVALCAEHSLEAGRALVDREGRLVGGRLDPDARRALGELKATMERLSGESLESSAYAKLRSDLTRVFPTVTRAIPLWCVTNLSVGGTFPLSAGLFDLVVIDEASQCDIPSAIPLLFRAKRAMIIGDPNQLRHISRLPRLRDRQLQHVHGLESAADQPYTFGANSLFDLASAVAGGLKVAELTEHFRSHEAIVRFSNERWYGGRLQVCTDYAKLAPVPDGLGVTWTDVRPGRGRRAERNTSPAEARAVADLVQALVTNPQFHGSVGVVTPFRAQANLIKQLLNDRLDVDTIRRTDLIVDTAHGFQGDERDVVFLSPCVGRGLSRGGHYFLTGTENLFNVALTRARSRLHVVGELEACRSCGIDYIEAFAAMFGSAGDGVHTGAASRRSATARAAASGAVLAEGPPAGSDLPWTSSGDTVGYYEAPLYHALVTAGVKPIPQYAEAQYKLDLAVIAGDLKLDLEVDGEYFHSTWSGEQARLDLRRDIRLTDRGWIVKRFWAQEVRDELGRCVEEVLEIVTRCAVTGQVPDARHMHKTGLQIAGR